MHLHDLHTASLPRRRSRGDPTELRGPTAVTSRLGVLKDMILFVEVARRKNFSEAAKILDVPLSTLARRIARLERELGVLLIERTTRQQRLTAEGREYFERCRHIVDDAMSTYESLHAKVHGLSGTIRLTVCELSGGFLLEIVKAFVDAHPHVSVDVMGEGPAVEGECDLAVKVGTPERDNLTARKLGILPVGLFAATGYLAGHSAIEARSQLREHALIVPHSFRDFCDPYLQEILAARAHAEPRLTFSNFSSLIVPLIAGQSGIAALPFNTAAPFVASGHLRAILPTWKPIALPVFAIMRDRRLTTRTRAFLTFLTKTVYTTLGAAPLALPDDPRNSPQISPQNLPRNSPQTSPDDAGRQWHAA